MFNAYVDVIGYLYPKVGCHAVGLEYSDIVHDSGDPIPAQAVLEPLILEVKRLKKWEEIKNYRDDRLEYGGYPTSQGFFHSDARSRDNYEDANKPNSRVLLATSPRPWKTMGGVFVNLTLTLLDALLANKVTQKNDTFYAAEVLKIALWLSTDPDNFDYKQNPEKTRWPLIYGE